MTYLDYRQKSILTDKNKSKYLFIMVNNFVIFIDYLLNNLISSYLYNT